jgi:hypothetical protein
VAGIADIAFAANGVHRPSFPRDNSYERGRTDADFAPRPSFGGE